MIYEVLQIVSDEVNNYLEELGLSRSVELNNIALIDTNPDDSNSPMLDSVILTLLNMKEENTMKNFPNKNVLENGKLEYRNELVNLNLYVLFCSNKTGYPLSLRYVSRIIEFFQGKRLFTHTNSSYDRNNPSMTEVGDFRFTMELYTPSFEELNFIWGTLGGKQYPSALYRLSLIQLERNISAKESTAISGVGYSNQISE